MRRLLARSGLHRPDHPLRYLLRVGVVALSGENVSMTTHYRIERDSMGEVRVPEGALYGPQTQRAVENFPISGMRFQRSSTGPLRVTKAPPANVTAGLDQFPRP